MKFNVHLSQVPAFDSNTPIPETGTTGTNPSLA